jgi:hypothetical protein
MTENIHQRPILISKREGGIFWQKRNNGEHSQPLTRPGDAEKLPGNLGPDPEGEEKANRDNATFKNRCNHRKTKEKTFSNRDKTASSGLPVIRPTSPE